MGLASSGGRHSSPVELRLITALSKYGSGNRVGFSVSTVSYTLGALSASRAHSFLSVTLLVGFVLLDGSSLGGGPAWLIMVALVLTAASLRALHTMASVAHVDFGYTLSLGMPWLARPR